MAKRITSNDTGTTAIQGPPQDISGDTPKAPEIPEADQAPLIPELKKEPEVKTAPHKQVQEIPEHADRILKSFSSYPKLYIDFQGGIFTVDTPPAFRSNATLYTNPYYKP